MNKGIEDELKSKDNRMNERINPLMDEWNNRLGVWDNNYSKISKIVQKCN